MKIQTIIWTAIPNGISTSGNLRLSVLVSPRLETDEKISGRPSPILRQFEDFLHWPPLDLKFSVAFDDSGVVRQLPAVITSKSDSNVWGALFKIDTPVESYTFDDYSSRIVRSYPAASIIAFIEKQYQRIATTNPTKFSPFSELMGQDSFRQIYLDEQLSATLLNEVLSKYGAVPPEVSLDIALDFFQLRLFHHPHNELDEKLTSKHLRPKYDEYKQAKLETKLDFHKVITLLQSYPKLLRLFGLVFEIEVTVPSGVNVPISSTVWVIPEWSPTLPNSKNISPQTKYMKGFRAQSGITELRDGMLDLTNPLYGLIEVDVDGAAIKAMNFASNILLSREKMMTVDTPDSFSVPSLQSAGLSLVRSGRGYSLKQDLVRSKKNNDDISSNKIVTLYAEDLIGGFRVDIFDKATRNWYSLCDRIATYRFLDGHIPPIVMEDEGYISLGATESATGFVESRKLSPFPDLYLSEALFRWSGWSLCVPRPTTRLTTPVSPLDHIKPEEYLQNDSIVSPQFRMLSTFSVKKQSLPRLRFGNIYRMRVRIADLTGTGLTKEQAGTLYATKEVTYLRFEPINAPVVILHHPIEDRNGESTERIVIRTRNDLPERDILDPPTSEISERYIASPICAPSLAETHGKFDYEGGLSKDAYGIIVSKEGTFQKVHLESKLILPYLPDPLCSGASFLGLPGQVRGLLGIPGAPNNKEIEHHSDGSVSITDLLTENPPINLTKVDFGPENEWPNFKPFLIRVKGTPEGKALIAPKWDAVSRVLTVSLPQAAIVTVRLSSYPRIEHIPLLGMWNWIKNTKLTPGELRKLGYPSIESLFEKLLYYSVQGRHWMMTPYRDLVLVHALQQPLDKVEFVHLITSKEIGKTFAVLVDDPQIHVKSTGTVEALAKWSETIDDLALDGPTSIERSARAFGFNLDYPDPTGPEENNLKKIEHLHEFGDTKYRSVVYTLLATTRFQDYFEKNPNDSINKFTRQSKPVSVDILNSARPDAPKVLYVIPTFGWFRNDEITKYKSIRLGGGLRIYLERPWFSSGDGEMLGIVLAGPNTSPSELERFEGYITRWGGDPIWSSSIGTFGPLERDFKNKITGELGITIDELGDISAGNNYSLAVLGYKVDYDQIRKLWYCDIEIDTHGQYFPFIRLAMVRYQPKSVKTTEEGKTKDVKVSHVVLADFVQLAPDRTASLTFASPDRSILDLAISGVPGIGKSESYKNEIEVAIEKRDPRKGGKDLGWTFVFKAEPSQSIPSGILWLGKINLPGPSHNIYRIVIKELEKIDIVKEDPADPTIGKRVVYAEIIEL